MRGLKGTVILMTIVLLVSLAPAVMAADDEFVISDPVGDVRPTVEGNELVPPLAANPVTGSVDITAIRVLHEDELFLRIAVEIHDLSSMVRNADAADYHEHSLSFRIDGLQIRYILSFGFPGTLFIETSADPRTDLLTLPGLRFCLNPEQAAQQGTQASCPATQRVRGWIDFSNSRFLFEVPKLSLLGSNPPEAGMPVSNLLPGHLPAGTSITGWHAVFRQRVIADFIASGASPVWLQDQAPDSGPSERAYILTKPSGNTAITLERGGIRSNTPTNVLPGSPVTGQTATAQFVVTADLLSAMPIVIENKLPSKRLVNLSVELPEGETRWTMRIAPTVEVPAEGSQVVNLVVTPSPEIRHGDVGLAIVRAVSLGHPEEIGVLHVIIEASEPPSVERPVLHPHVSLRPPGGNFNSDQFFCDGGPTEATHLCSQSYRYWLNTLAEDDRATRDEAVPLNAVFLAPPGRAYLMDAFFPMDTALAHPLILDPETPAGVRAVFSAGVPLEIFLRAQIGLTAGPNCPPTCGGFLALGEAETRAVIGTQTPVTLEIRLDPQYQRINPDEGRLQLRLSVYSDDLVATYSVAEDAWFHPRQSELTLPITAVDRLEGLTSTIGIYVDGDTEEFVNPDRVKLFRLVVVNEGIDNSRVEVAATADEKGWGIEFRPASRFSLAPGESVRIALAVRPPQAVAEGETATFRVAARSMDRAEDVATIVLRAIATSGIQIPDEAEAFEADPDTLAKIYVDEPSRTPSVVWPVVVLALVGAALLHGRAPVFGHRHR